MTKESSANTPGEKKRKSQLEVTRKGQRIIFDSSATPTLVRLMGKESVREIPPQDIATARKILFIAGLGISVAGNEREGYRLKTRKGTMVKVIDSHDIETIYLPGDGPNGTNNGSDRKP